MAAGVPASLYGAELYDKLGIDAAGEAVPELMIDVLPGPGYDPATYAVAGMCDSDHPRIRCRDSVCGHKRV